MPEWAVPLDQVAEAARAQASILTGRAYTDAEAGLLLQWAEDLDAAARVLRAVAEANAKRAAAMAGNQNARREENSPCTSSARTESRGSDQPERKAKAAATGTNRGAVQRGE
jgi:hypothetical protein